MRRICVVLVDRANYGRLYPVMFGLRDSRQVELQTILGGSMVLERFGSPWTMLEDDGVPISHRLYHEVEGGLPLSSTLSIGMGVIQYSLAIDRLDPEIVVVIGDRFEAMAAAIATAYTGRTLVHFQGGEVSRTIDESTRHAITKLAHYHVPATDRAAEYVMAMGEPESSILGVGCPSADIAAHVHGTQRRHLLCICHPSRHVAIDHVLDALQTLQMPTFMFWPNIDAGSADISKRMRQLGQSSWLHFVKNVHPYEFMKLLAGAKCCVGNSSSFVRDAGYFGTPVVMIGDRQTDREHAGNVRAWQGEPLAALIQGQCNASYPPSDLYGRPGISAHVVRMLETLPAEARKHLAYVDEEGMRAERAILLAERN